MFQVRRMTLQLTPLLDLLLIVIFAQYMDIRQTTLEEETQSSRRFEQLQTELEEARQSQSRALADLTAAEDRMQDLAGIAELRTASEQELEERLAASADELERAQEQKRLVGELTAELFRIPNEQIEELLAQPPMLSPAERAQLKEQFREMGSARGDELVKHLLTYEELRKRADIWEIYVAENGRVSFLTDRLSREFRADSPEGFASQLYEAYKSLPQPKGLVIILLSYGDARFGPRDAALRGLPLAAARMREDAAGRTRFEYAVLGFRVEPPQRAEGP